MQFLFIPSQVISCMLCTDDLCSLLLTSKKMRLHFITDYGKQVWWSAQHWHWFTDVLKQRGIFRLNIRTDKKLGKTFLLPKLTHLTIWGDLEVQECAKLSILSSLRYLDFKTHSCEGDQYYSLFLPRDFNMPLYPNFLPSNLTQLELGTNFKHPLQHLPKNLQRLSFGFASKFNNVMSLPSSLCHLSFSAHFNQPLTSILFPTTIQELFFGSDFNQPIQTSALPLHITHLHFGFHFNQPITSLPDSITRLHFGHCFDSIICALPSSLQRLKLGWKYNQPLPFLPPTLELLRIGNKKIGSNFNQLFSQPPQLKMLRLGNGYTHPIPVFSSHLVKLTLVHYHHLLPPHLLPDLLETLRMERYDYLIGPNVLPPKLRKFKLSNHYFGSPAFPHFPPSLQYLSMRCKHPITSKESFPPHLIQFHYISKYPLKTEYLPLSVQIVKVNDHNKIIQNCSLLYSKLQIVIT